MKAFFASIFRKRRRRRALHTSNRKRPVRSFASTFAPLEGRALLSVVIGPVDVPVQPLTATTMALIASPSPLTIAMPQGGHGQGGGSSTGVAPVSSSGSSGSGNSNTSAGATHPAPAGSDDPKDSDHATAQQPGDHVAMDVEKAEVDGKVTPELALADFASSEVIVRLGFDGQPIELGPAQGVDHPGSVVLADLNDDGIPDLIVVNTNGNNILVFPGLGNGQFGPEEDGGQGFAVGLDPVSVTVNYVDDDASKAQLIVANAESDSVTILSGQAAGGAWSVNSVGTIATASLPTKTLLYDVTNDGTPDLLVCNTGSDEVTLYEGLGAGAFATQASATFAVGLDPEAMFVGPFDRHLQPDLVTVNAGSDDVTFIGDVFGPQQATQTISSGGTSPDAAFAIDPGHTGVLDLVVANGGDGHVSIFRGGNDGLQLAGVITQASIPSPTALAPGYAGSDAIDFFAASAGSDAALLLHFDLGVASTYLPGTSGEASALGQEDNELFAQLMPFDEASLDLIAVLWAGGPDGDAILSASSLREPSTITALYSPTEGQGEPELGARLPEGPSGPPTPPAGPVDPLGGGGSLWARMVSGVSEALAGPHGFVGALAARDLPDGGVESPMDGLARLDLEGRGGDRPVDADLEIPADLLDGGTIRLFRPGDTPAEGAEPVDPPSRSDPLHGFDTGDAPALQGRLEAVPLISTALFVSTRLIIKASPPRPPAFRARSWLRRFVSLEHDRGDGDRPGRV